MHEKKKFLILAQSRSGTQLLRALLHSHPDIHCDGELLHRNLQYTGFRWLRELLRLYPEPLLQHWQNKASAPVFGFNMMFYHMIFPKPTLLRLVNSNWHVIHLMREDLLQIALSFLIASRSGEWHREAGDRCPQHTFTITPAELERELIKRSKWRAFEIELVNDIPHREVLYERDLLDNGRWQSTCDAIFGELRVDSSPVSTSFRKSDRRGPGEIIENFTELQIWLRSSPYRSLLNTATRN
jgi:hypothetical protein